MLGQLNQILLHLVFSMHQVIYLISVVNSAIKANCLVCHSDGRSVTDDITLKAYGRCSRKNNGLLSCA